jgi:hypothetical protein
MKGMLAALSPHEETALRKVGFGADDRLDPLHLRRLLQLELIEWGGYSWRLTPAGQRRYNTLVTDVARPSAAA